MILSTSDGSTTRTEVPEGGYRNLAAPQLGQRIRQEQQIDQRRSAIVDIRVSHLDQRRGHPRLTHAAERIGTVADFERSMENTT